MVHRRNILKGAAGVGLASLAGCLGGDNGGVDTRPIEIDFDDWPPEEYGDSLHAWNWYAEWNEWGAEAFAEEYDLNNFETEAYSTPADWFTNIEANPEGHDIDNVGLSTNWIHEANEQDMLEPIPVDEMPNVDVIDDYFDLHREEFWSDEGVGGVYGVPHSIVLGPVVVYNTNEIEDPTESIEILWDEEYADEMSIFAHQAGFFCELGALYTGQDPNDPDDFEEIQEVLEQQRDLVFNYGDEHETQMQLLMSGDAAIGTHTDGRAFRAMYDHDGDVDWFIPEEGSVISPNELAIPKHAPHPVVSTMFTDFMFRDESLEKMVETTVYRPPLENEEFTDGELGQAIRENWDDWGKTGDPEDFIDDLVITDDEMDRLHPNWPRSDEVIERYDEIWTAVTAG
ncbi:ABC-type transport system periplasmic substrate-binding protein (probable substrate spermidine/putrescine) [Natrialba magadii ATCC 43099]|uniref:ABC-type transport system periplasmic substrate-binding protein (Probable substrate spermidine/putrescine) n=1 Tax=Natrialba magadii (strain ATCC 43099 / DSM 3394 / CCM 3739 / CIP 104546 / IAM 13178 / JCM 8861 / NBRC 102185 / NCIMB 2190 / MS3) TaxID=547559 RepID=D3SWB2_NATMM|nr:extracellular solute-binding protein [Natrialba magadii]ADD03704.1 ABC-type transport system periplasmic substrate-binding protein (probable substrate spermidine/putrescine) [Natrialba magadii ATCC 43099]ELY34468.1 spermidine/putrescine-binding periplasmic protein-like protein [Natrialba magadii ATCC 43099]